MAILAMASIPPIYILYGLTGLAVVWIVYELFLSPLSHIPGPFTAKFTDFYRSILTYRGNVDGHKRTWHRKWGSAVRVGPNAISISDPDLIRVIYNTKAPWRKSEMYRPNDVLVNGQRMQNIFNTQDPHFHARFARPIAAFWSMTRTLELEPLVDESINEFMASMDKRFAKTGDVCMMEDWLSYYAWDTAGNISFGSHYGFMETGADVGGIIKESTDGLAYFAPVSQIPWIDEWLDKNPVWRIGPRPLVNGMMYTVKALAEYKEQIAAGAEKRKSVDLFIDRYYSTKFTTDYIDDNQVINWLMLNVVAGGDSTSRAMRPVVYHVAKHLAVYEKLVDELQGADLSTPVQWNEINKLTYFDAVMRESQRLSPALGLMLERDVPKGGFQLPDGRVLPAGTKVGMNPCVVTRDRGLFGDDADEFRPDRWLRREDEGEEEFARRFRRMHDAADLMYGHGTRVCMGKHFAKISMYKMFATLYSTYDIKLTDANHEWKYRNSWFMYHTDIPCIITRRQKT